MMSQLAPPNREGEYQRPQSEFRDRITVGGKYPPAANRYRLYVGWSCPWAHRAIVVRALKGLEGAIDMCILEADANAGGWVFPDSDDDCHTLRDLYRVAKPGYVGRATVPLLWDMQTKSIVNNESAEIIEILNSEFNEFATRWQSLSSGASTLDLAPIELQGSIDDWNEIVYEKVNNGVYRCGFAQTQTAYDRAHTELFDTLDRIDNLLTTQSYLCGDLPTLADVRLFTTLIRFDLVYYTLFKCNRRRIQDYAHLRVYLQDFYHLAGISATCNFPAILQDYYGNLFPLNPGGIIPKLPDLTYLELRLASQQGNFLD